MANALYDKGREKFLDAAIDMNTDTIKAVLVKSAYVPDLNLHDFYDDVVANVVGTPVTLLNPTIVDGVFDADDVTFTSVPGPDQVKYILIYDDTPATDATKPLIALIDTATGLPFTPGGGNVDIAWDSGSNKIFKL